MVGSISQGHYFLEEGTVLPLDIDSKLFGLSFDN